MTIDIQQLVNSKLSELKENHTIEALIADGVEKAIIKAVDDTLTGYSFRRNIEEKISGGMDDALKSVDFSTYNGFVVDTIKTMIQGTVRADLRARAEKTISSMFICDRTEIKLSEIFTAYRNMLIDGTDPQDQYDRERFFVQVEEEGKYGWLDIALNPEQLVGYRASQNAEIRFTVHKRQDGSGFIGSVYIDGISLSEKLKLGHLNDVELMLIQATYNNVRIVIDVDDVDDIDTSYDVDI